MRDLPKTVRTNFKTTQMPRLSVFKTATIVPFNFSYYILLISEQVLLTSKLCQPEREETLANGRGIRIILRNDINTLIPLPSCNHLSQLAASRRQLAENDNFEAIDM